MHQTKAYKVVSRRDLSVGGFSGSSSRGGAFGGSNWGVTRRREQVLVMRRTFLEDWGCSCCDHQWTKEVVEDSQDFEID
jgi:hypothetical protein